MPLCFSDATALTDTLVCFTASAEGPADGDFLFVCDQDDPDTPSPSS